ncbi:MAG: low molecular weight phosphotyrosine protein phosphatase [Deltaproteobacteria bacterium]|nr:low molecular weight phosphotyrosine protein phosphatase [Deltaproteobacteria bacterium]
MKIRVCFVCTGNICRSPTAGAIFRHLVTSRGIEHRFTVESAGMHGWHVGELAHPPTRAEAESRGVPITSRARQWKRDDFHRYDYVVGMDRGHVEALLRMAPSEEARAKVHLFRDFDPASRGRDVPDPYYEGGYDHVFDVCDAAARAMLDELLERHSIR